jgi:hypothetical protein
MDSFDPAILDAPTIAGSNSQDSAWRFPWSGESALHGGKAYLQDILVKPAIERAFFLLRAGDLRLSDANYLLKQKF